MKAEGKQLKVFLERKDARAFATSVIRKGYGAKLSTKNAFGVDMYWVWYWKKEGQR